MIALTHSEAAALRWLLDGNGQKFVSVGAPDGPFAEQQATLVATHRGLETKRLVVIGGADYYGTRSVNITDAGRAALLALGRVEDSASPFTREAKGGG